MIHTPHPNHPPVVYYVTSQFGGVVKIGTTVNLSSRMRRLEKAQPSLEVRVLATELGSQRLEAHRHKQFAPSHQIGEWYWMTPAVVAHIERIAGGAL